MEFSPMEKVYQYKVFDISSGQMRHVNSFAVESFIRKIEGSEVPYETIKEVSKEELDGDGKLIKLNFAKE
jgi:hypothetical protein